MSGRPAAARKRDVACLEPRAPYSWRLVGQCRPGAARSGAADRPDPAVPEILDRRYSVGVADDFRGRQSRHRRRCRPAYVGAEPVPVVHVAPRLRPPDQPLLRRRVSALRLVHRAVCRAAAGAVRTGRAVESAGIFRRAELRCGVRRHDAGDGIDASGQSGQFALPRARALWPDRGRAGVGDGGRASGADRRRDRDRQPAGCRAGLRGGAVGGDDIRAVRGRAAAISLHREILAANFLALGGGAIHRRLSLRRDEFCRGRVELYCRPADRRLRFGSHRHRPMEPDAHHRRHAQGGFAFR